MKAKAASKSTNWNLRVMASRPSASRQSGNRFRAAFRSSIGSWGIRILQRIIALDRIDAAVTGQPAGIEMERINTDSGAGEKRVMGQPFDHLVAIRVAQPRQGHMWHE